MLRIVLIHPGSTDYDQQRRIQGNLDVPLNEQGNVEIARVIEEVRLLGIEEVYTACGEPAGQTARAVAEALDVKVKKLDRMANLNLGLWQGMLIEEVRLKQPKVYRQWQEHPEHICPPEGEMLDAARERVQACLTRLLKRRKAGVIAVVASEPLASLVRRCITHDPLGDLWKAADGHGRWEVIEPKPETLVPAS